MWGWGGFCVCFHFAPHYDPHLWFLQKLGTLWRPTGSLSVFHMRGIGGVDLGEKTVTAVVMNATGGTKKVSIREVGASGLISFISELEVI